LLYIQRKILHVIVHHGRDKFGPNQRRRVSTGAPTQTQIGHPNRRGS